MFSVVAKIVPLLFDAVRAHLCVVIAGQARPLAGIATVAN